MSINVMPFMPDQHAETPRIAETQDGVGKNQVHVVVLFCRHNGRYQPKAAGHAQVQNQPAAVQLAFAVEKQIFSAPVNPVNT